MSEETTPDERRETWAEESREITAVKKRGPGERREPAQRTLDLARAVNMAVAGANYRQIAAEMDVSEEAVRQHLLSPEGQKALRWAVNDIQERTDRFLASAHLQALRRLVREMEEAERSSDRIRAAQAIVGLAAKRIEITGADGGPIEMTAGVAEALAAKFEAAEKAALAVIDVEPVEPEAPRALKEA